MQTFIAKRVYQFPTIASLIEALGSKLDWQIAGQARRGQGAGREPAERGDQGRGARQDRGCAFVETPSTS